MRQRTRPKLPACPENWSVAFARRLLAALGADVSQVTDRWCWDDFGKVYAEYRPAVEKYLEQATTGDPSWAAYHMVRYCGSHRAWAEKVINEAVQTRVGEPAWAAWQMLISCHSSKRWAEDMIERAARAGMRHALTVASHMVQYCGSSRAWAERITARHSKPRRAGRSNGKVR